MNEIKGNFLTHLREGAFFNYDSMTWRIYKVMNENTFTAWEESGEVGSLETFTVETGTFNIHKED